MTRKEIVQKHNSWEIAEWIAFYQLEPEMFYPGAVPSKKKGKKKQSAEEMKSLMMGLVKPDKDSAPKEPIKLRNRKAKRPLKKRK